MSNFNQNPTYQGNQTPAAGNEKTDFHFFCEQLCEDIIDRTNSDAVGPDEIHLSRKLVDLIREAQNFKGHNAPVDDAELMADIAVYNAPRASAGFIGRVASTIVFMLFSLFSFGQSLIAFDASLPTPITPTIHRIWETVKPGDTVRVGIRTTCAPSTIYSGYRIRVKISDTATGLMYLGPDKKRIPKGCQIIEIIRLKGTDLNLK